MRVLTLISATLASALICGAASAAPAAPSAPSVSAAASSADDSVVAVQRIQGGQRRMPTADAATLAGRYPLSNGSQLRVSYERQRLYAELGDRRMELSQTGATTFVGRGTGVNFTFDQVPFATGVTVTY